jgi:ribosome-binding factor A
VADQARARRLAKRIAQIVASALEHEVKDPRLAKVTITDAKVTGDLHDATVYYTVLGDKLDSEPDFAGARAALESAKGVLRSMVGQQTGVRFTPTLAFVTDTVPDTARHMEELLARAREADAEVARLASGAEPAGDPDPYKAPRDESEDAEESDEAEDAVEADEDADDLDDVDDLADAHDVEHRVTGR